MTAKKMEQGLQVAGNTAEAEEDENNGVAQKGRVQCESHDREEKKGQALRAEGVREAEERQAGADKCEGTEGTDYRRDGSGATARSKGAEKRGGEEAYAAEGNGCECARRECRLADQAA